MSVKRTSVKRTSEYSYSYEQHPLLDRIYINVCKQTIWILCRNKITFMMFSDISDVKGLEKAVVRLTHLF